jgi:hypothetical protein
MGKSIRSSLKAEKINRRKTLRQIFTKLAVVAVSLLISNCEGAGFIFQLRHRLLGTQLSVDLLTHFKQMLEQWLD